jgi:hypothetical protein
MGVGGFIRKYLQANGSQFGGEQFDDVVSGALSQQVGEIDRPLIDGFLFRFSGPGAADLKTEFVFVLFAPHNKQMVIDSLVQKPVLRDNMTNHVYLHVFQPVYMPDQII